MPGRWPMSPNRSGQLAALAHAIRSTHPAPIAVIKMAWMMRRSSRRHRESGACLSLQAGMGTTVPVLPDLEEISYGRMVPKNLRDALYALIRSETLAPGPEAVRAWSRPDPLPGTTAARGSGG